MQGCSFLLAVAWRPSLTPRGHPKFLAHERPPHGHLLHQSRRESPWRVPATILCIAVMDVTSYHPAASKPQVPPTVRQGGHTECEHIKEIMGLLLWCLSPHCANFWDNIYLVLWSYLFNLFPTLGVLLIKPWVTEHLLCARLFSNDSHYRGSGLLQYVRHITSIFSNLRNNLVR